jgi:diguanylate cyclase (GGDEF)-like protein
VFPQQEGKMSGAKQEQSTKAPKVERGDEIQQQIHELSSRDLQLWSIGILVMLVLTAGVLALIWPNLMWRPRIVHVEQNYLPQLFFGLICLIVLSNIYLLAQKRALNATRKRLIRELVLNERLESLSLIDHLTQLLNRRAMNELIPQEVARANRQGASLTFLMIDLNNFRSINSQHGHAEGDEVLVEFATILKSIFRGGDVVFRNGGDEFLIAMPDTSEEQAEYPVQRLQKMVENWNAQAKKAYELSFSWGVASYVTGADVADVLRSADRKMYQKKHKLVPVF